VERPGFIEADAVKRVVTVLILSGQGYRLIGWGGEAAKNIDGQKNPSKKFNSLAHTAFTRTVVRQGSAVAFAIKAYL